MQILFIADPLESFKIYKDTTFAMMRELQRRGHTLAVCEPRHVSLGPGPAHYFDWRDGLMVCSAVRWHRSAGRI